MMERGNYRSIHTVIVDGPDFQALSPGAKLVWYTLKMTLGPSGIAVIPALTGTLMERTGLEAPQVEKGIAQLVAAGWVQVERNIAWMVEGLRHDPHLRLNNQNHRTQIAQHLNGLPRLAIVAAFRAHYGFAEQPAEMPSVPSEHGLADATKMASTIPSNMASEKPSRIREEGKGRGKGKRETEKGEGISAAGASGTGGSTRSGRETWLTPFATTWRARYGGEMGAGRAVKALSRLVQEHGVDEVLRRWEIYLAATAAEYANAPKFAETWGRWAEAGQTARVVRMVGASPAALGQAATLWTRYKAANLLTQWPLAEYQRIGATLVAEGHYASVDAFLAELRQTEPWTLRDARTDGWAINQLAGRLSGLKVAS